MVKYKLTLEEQIKECEEIVEKYPRCKLAQQRLKYIAWFKALQKLTKAFNDIETLKKRIKYLENKT